MKIIGLTGTQFIVAIIFALAVCFVVITATSPHPVEQPTIVLTPVPTPAPVLIQPTQQAPYDGNSDSIIFPAQQALVADMVETSIKLMIPLIILSVLFSLASAIMRSRREW